MKINGNGNIKVKTFITVIFSVSGAFGAIMLFMGGHVIANEKDRVRDDKEIRECIYSEIQETRQEIKALDDKFSSKFDDVNKNTTQILVELGKIQEQIKNGQ